jgi:hypothetical protein
MGIADILNESVEVDGEGWHEGEGFDAQLLKGHLISEDFGIAKAIP